MREVKANRHRRGRVIEVAADSVADGYPEASHIVGVGDNRCAKRASDVAGFRISSHDEKPRSLPPFLASRQLGNAGLPQLRQFLFDDRLDRQIVYRVVLVTQHVSEPANAAPWNMRLVLLDARAS